MSFRYELGVLLTYIMVLSVLSILFSMARVHGVVGEVVNSPSAQNMTVFVSNNSNWSVSETNSQLIPPRCEPIFTGTPIPILDDVGCLGVMISWLTGFREFTSSSVWFTILFIVPVIVVAFVMIVRMIRGN